MFFPIIIVYFILGITILLFYLLWCKFTSRLSRISLFHLLLMLGPISWFFIILALILLVSFVMIRDIRMQKKRVLDCEPTTVSQPESGENHES